jgi:methylmalonyl-CoA mutase C-terminal domain/subunit
LVKQEKRLSILTSRNEQTPPKVLLAKMGLDGHDRGVKVIARAMRDSGFEVVYMGMRVTAEQIAQTALQEDADVLGISILSGAHMRLMPRLTKALDERGLAGDVLLLVGGTIPEDDVGPLQEMGVHGVFPVGSFTTDMIDFINTNMRRQT